MKQLSINHISAASIRANRKTYLSLAAGIVFAVVLATVMTLCAFGLIEAREQQVVQTVGHTDCVLLDEPDITDEFSSSPPRSRTATYIWVIWTRRDRTFSAAPWPKGVCRKPEVKSPSSAARWKSCAWKQKWATRCPGRCCPWTAWKMNAALLSWESCGSSPEHWM